jgi:hypothetical protein
MALGVTCLREIGIFLLVSFEILMLGSEPLSGLVQANVSPVIDGCLWMGYSWVSQGHSRRRKVDQGEDPTRYRQSSRCGRRRKATQTVQDEELGELLRELQLLHS